MAISQHQFYLDRKQCKGKVASVRSVEDMAADLTDHGGSRSTRLDVMKNNVITASNGSLVSTGSADSEANDEQKKEKISELRKKEQEIQGVLNKKTKELKKICLREAELTGKLPKEYPLSSGERPPQVRRRVGTTFKLDELFPYNEDPYLRNLESRFALQRKIVEAAKKLANEADICKTVKKKRRRNCLDAMTTLQHIENQMNAYRIKQGKKPTQRASVIIADELGRSDCSSVSSLPLEDDDDSDRDQRPRSRSVQGSASPQLSPAPSPMVDLDRHVSPKDRHLARFAFEGHQEAGLYYQSPREASSNHSSPYKTLPRPPRDPRSMPPTPVMTRNAYSSSQLRSEVGGHGFRHRSGSLESQPRLGKDLDSEKPVFTLSPRHRSNSTEALEDLGSNYTSLSSLDYCGPPTQYNHPRRVEVYGGNTGSMPNLVHSPSSYAYEPPAPHYAPCSSFYAAAGFPGSSDSEAFSTAAAYVYENEVEGHYNLNPNYQVNGYHGHDRYRHYSVDQSDGLSQQNPYATVRPPPRSRKGAGPRNQLLAKSMQKALVAEHLRGWYQRSGGRDNGHNDGHKGTGGYDGYDGGSQLSLGYQTLPAPFSPSSRTTSYSSVSSVNSTGTGTWRNNLSVGLTDYDNTPESPPYGQQGAPYSRSPTHSRFLMDRVDRGFLVDRGFMSLH